MLWLHPKLSFHQKWVPSGDSWHFVSHMISFTTRCCPIVGLAMTMVYDYCSYISVKSDCIKIGDQPTNQRWLGVTSQGFHVHGQGAWSHCNDRVECGACRRETQGMQAAQEGQGSPYLELLTRVMSQKKWWLSTTLRNKRWLIVVFKNWVLEGRASGVYCTKKRVRMVYSGD